MESKTVLKNYAKFTERHYFVEQTVLEGLSPKLIILRTEFFCHGSRLEYSALGGEPTWYSDLDSRRSGL